TPRHVVDHARHRAVQEERAALRWYRPGTQRTRTLRPGDPQKVIAGTRGGHHELHPWQATIDRPAVAHVRLLEAEIDTVHHADGIGGHEDDGLSGSTEGEVGVQVTLGALVVRPDQQPSVGWHDGLGA